MFTSLFSLMCIFSFGITISYDMYRCTVKLGIFFQQKKFRIAWIGKLLLYFYCSVLRELAVIFFFFFGSLCITIVKHSNDNVISDGPENLCSSVHSWVGSVSVCRSSDLAASGAGNGSVRLWGIESESKGIRPLFELPLVSLHFFDVLNMVELLPFLLDIRSLLAKTLFLGWLIFCHQPHWNLDNKKAWCQHICLFFHISNGSHLFTKIWGEIHPWMWFILTST